MALFGILRCAYWSIYFTDWLTFIHRRMTLVCVHWGIMPMKGNIVYLYIVYVYACICVYVYIYIHTCSQTYLGNLLMKYMYICVHIYVYSIFIIYITKKQNNKRKILKLIMFDLLFTKFSCLCSTSEFCVLL